MLRKMRFVESAEGIAKEEGHATGTISLARAGQTEPGLYWGASGATVSPAGCHRCRIVGGGRLPLVTRGGGQVLFDGLPLRGQHNETRLHMSGGVVLWFVWSCRSAKLARPEVASHLSVQRDDVLAALHPSPRPPHRPPHRPPRTPAYHTSPSVRPRTMHACTRRLPATLSNAIAPAARQDASEFEGGGRDM